MIYLDNSATTWPKPAQVRAAAARGLSDLGANPGRGGYPASAQAAWEVYQCRKKAAALLGARGPEHVSFQPSCTQALNLVLSSQLQKGDHAVVSDLEHNAVMRPLAALAAQRGVTWTAARTVPGDNDATLEQFRQAMGPRTKLVVCTGASNVFGIKLPVARLAALCHQYGAKLCVDAAQTAGLVPMNVEEEGLDYLCCAGHKGLYGPMGVGLLVLRDLEEPLAPLLRGGTGTQSRSLAQPEASPERYESGTLNVPGILGLSAGLDFVRRQGPESLCRRELSLLRELYRQLQAVPGAILYTPEPDPNWSVPVLAFNLEGLPSEETGRLLAQRGFALRCGLHCAPLAHEKMGTAQQGAVRVSPSAFTKPWELESLARAVRRIAP